jgi:hypothetical protein
VDGLVGRLRAARWRRALESADGLLFAAAGQGEAWRRAGIVGATQSIGVVMEGSSVFTPQARQAARTACGVTGRPAILWVGRLNANKDPLTVLAAVEQAALSLPALTLDMVYEEAPLLSAVRQRIDASDLLRGRVRLLGRIAHERLPLHYSAADLFVLGSHHEGSGYAATLWAPGDADRCRDSLAHGASIAGETTRTAVRSHFEHTLSWPVIGARALAIYREVHARRNASTPAR